MTHIYEPRLSRIAIDKLRPTQIAVGFREVELKRKEWRETRKKTETIFWETTSFRSWPAPRIGLISSTTITSFSHSPRRAWNMC